MVGITPAGIAGYTSGAVRPQTKVARNGVVSSSVGGFNISPTGQINPLAAPGGLVPGQIKPKPPKIIPGQIDITPGEGKLVPGQLPAPAVPKPKTPSWQDADYNSQISAIQRALDLYKSQMGVQRTRAGTQYADSSRDMDQQKVRDSSDMENDFASRGVVTSGVYGTSVGDYNKEWGQQKEGLSKQYKDALADITMNYTSYLNDIKTQKEQARLDAVRRRAQELELNPPKKKGPASKSTKGLVPGKIVVPNTPGKTKQGKYNDKNSKDKGGR